MTYAVDSREDVLRAADVCLEHNVFMETGPSQTRHPANIFSVRI